MDKIKILAVLAARGGSRGIKNKNIRDLLGKPLIAYTIEQIIRWGKFEKFIVSTDSEKIAEIAKDYGAEVPFLRPTKLATDTANKMDALRHAFRQAEKHYRRNFDCLLDLDATAPIRNARDIDNIVGIFKKNKPDCVFSVVDAHRNPYFNLVEKLKDGTVKVCKELPAHITRRQDAPAVYAMNASLYIYDRDFLLDANNQTPYARRALIYKMDELSAFDIDREIDFKFIEFLIKEGLVKI